MPAFRLIASITAILMFAEPTLAEVVSDWQNPVHYPARVTAIQWPNGRLDAHNSMRFGAWTIRFGPPLQFAVYFGFETIWIGGDNPSSDGPVGDKVFRCSNAAIGERLCTFRFFANARVCELQVWISGKIRDNQYLRIPCPTALNLI